MVTKLTPEERIDATMAQLEEEIAAKLATERLDAELRAIVRFCESKYGIPSSEIHEAIDDGRLIESKEVVDWIFAHEILEGIF